MILATAAVLVVSVGCGQGGGPIDTETVRQALDGRSIQARLSGLQFGTCTSTDELIPVADCAAAGREPDLRLLGRLARDLDRRLDIGPTVDELHAAALLRVGVAADDVEALRLASVYLREAASMADDAQRGVIVSDLSAVQLQLAEMLQSPREVVAALEAALWAIELDPGRSEAVFNRDLALFLLGFDPELAAGSPADPWITELAGRLAPARRTVQRPPCLTRAGARQALDAWARSGSEKAAALSDHRDCLAEVNDRHLPDLLRFADADPDGFSAIWQRLRNAETALEAFDLEATSAGLKALSRAELPPPISLEARWIEATANYLRLAYDRSLDLLGPLAKAASEVSAFELAARAHRLRSLIHQIRGEYGDARTSVHEALAAASRSCLIGCHPPSARSLGAHWVPPA